MPIAFDRLSTLQCLKLIHAVNNGKQEQIANLIEFGVVDLVNYAEPFEGQTGLHHASCQNNYDILKQLLSLGADCNVGDFEGRTPLMRAAEFGHVECLTILLDVPENVNYSAKDLDGKSMLYYCLYNTKRHERCLRLALQHGADVHNVRNDNVSLLSAACQDGLESMIACLVEFGIDVNYQHKKSGMSPLHIACENGYNACVKLLLQSDANPNVHTYEHKYPAHSAAMKDELDILQMLSAYGAHFNVVDRDGNTPMHLSAANGLSKICKFLALRGCVPIKNGDGMTAHVLAKSFRHMNAYKECKKAERLRERIPDTQHSIAPFYDWIISNKRQLMKEVELSAIMNVDSFTNLLCSRKAPIKKDELIPILRRHLTKKDGVLDYDLFFTGKKFVNKHFITEGIKKKGKGKSKKGKKKKVKVEIPIFVKENNTCVKDRETLINYIEDKKLQTDFSRFDKDSKPWHPIQDDSVWYSYQPEKTHKHISEAIKYDDMVSLSHAIKHGLDINGIDKFYKTPLMTACLQGSLDTINYLIAHGADVNAQDSFKWTPLHFACHYGQPDIVRTLLDHGAVLDAQATNGGTPLMRAVESSNIDVVKLLLSKGAKLRLVNKKGQNAVDIASEFGDFAIIETVEKHWKALPPSVNKKKKNAKRKQNAKKIVSKSRIATVSIDRSCVNLKKSENILTESMSYLISAKAEDVSIVYTPKRAWVCEPTTSMLKEKRRQTRERLGDEVDFDDYQPSFQRHITNLVEKHS